MPVMARGDYCPQSHWTAGLGHATSSYQPCCRHSITIISHHELYRTAINDILQKALNIL